MKLLEAHAPPQHPSLLCMHLNPSQATLSLVLPAARDQQAGPYHVRILRAVLFVLAAARDVLRDLGHLRVVQAQVRRALSRAYGNGYRIYPIALTLTLDRLQGEGGVEFASPCA